MTEVTYNDIVLDIPDDEVVAINKQVNDIAQLDAFKSDFTREFKIKRTREMELLFESAANVNSQTEKPYQSLYVNVTFNGLQAVTNGRMAINRSDELYYYCSIYSGAINIFELLKEKTINAIDLSDLEHTWSAAVAAASLDGNLDYQYLACDFSDDGGLVGGVDPLTFQAGTLRPFVRVSRLFNDIFEGYNLINDVAADALFLKMFIPINTLKAPKEAANNFLSQGYQTLFNIGVLTWGEILFDPAGCVDEYGENYTAKINGTFYFQVTGPALYWYTEISGKVNGVAAGEYLGYTTGGFLAYSYLYKVDLLIGDNFRLYATHGTYFYHAPYLISCYNIEPTTIGLSSVVNPAMYLPAIKQSDFVKSICYFFGLVPDYDELTNTIRLWNIGKLYTNKPIAMDWSDYLSMDSEDLEYRLDYARLNWMKWKADKDVGEGNGNSFIALNDQNASKEKTLYTMPFAYCDEVTHEGETMARIGWFESILDGTDYKTLEKVTERIVTREVMGVGISIDGSEPTTSYKARVQNLDLSTSVNYNDVIVRMLNKTKSLKLKFNLPITEVVNLDHSVPVFLKQYSEYFFIKKVSNYIEDQICTVELIRL